MSNIRTVCLQHPLGWGTCRVALELEFYLSLKSHPLHIDTPILFLESSSSWRKWIKSNSSLLPQNPGQVLAQRIGQ